MAPPTPTPLEVTVLITAHQTPAAYLREAVASALAQPVEGLEVLVVDDGSVPPLRTHLADFADARLVYHRMEHAGLPHALIEGVARARGRYVAILDHDDRLTADSLRPRLEAIRKSGVGLVYGDLELMDPDGRVYGVQRFPDLPDPSNFRWACLASPIGPLKHGTLLMDRQVALAVGNYQADLPIEYDLDLVLRLARAAGHLHLPVVVAQYRVHAGNFSRSFTYRLRQIRYRWRVMDQHVPPGFRRTAAKGGVAVVNLAKAAWQALTHRRPRRLLNGFR